jgi:hypothetical protein
MNAAHTKITRTTGLLACAGLALLLCLGLLSRPAVANAETPPPPPGIPSLPEPPASPEAAAEEAPAAPAVEAPDVPASAAPSTSPAPAGHAPRHTHCRRHCRHHHGRRHRRGATAGASSVAVGGITAGTNAYYSTCYRAVYGDAYNTSSLGSNGVYVLPEMYDWATGRWTWPSYWTPADAVTEWALTAYRPYSYVYVWYAKYAGGAWRFSAEWVGIQEDLDNGFC